MSKSNTNIHNISTVIGRPVLSVNTANNLGKVSDFAINPGSGELVGLAVQKLDNDYGLVEYSNIHSIGPDAVMIEDDQALLPPDQSTIKGCPLAQSELIGVKVISEEGQLMGKISKVFMQSADQPVFVYEVSSSIFDKLLGRGFYFPSSLARAYSDDGTSLVVTNDPEKIERRLEAVAKRLAGTYGLEHHQPGMPQITVRSHS
jgi:uncharacterized protein YrrD